MASTEHRGAGMLVSNPSKTLFFVQQKDAGYPHHQWRFAYSVWGGAMEETDASPLHALLREIEEEIALKSFFSSSNLNEERHFEPNEERPFHFTLFSCQLTDKELYSLLEAGVFEGDARILRRDELFSRPWVWGLDEVVHYYLNT